ncbi:class II fructose-bisphosphatase [Acidiphilium sp. PA]|uniref:class II fructose-bisphosphatase n=1 Tax=Acidiphilium sp. PA TaxID=2871705 RepID=UPI0022434C4A|nr:class II fructose-bisphosphatase [Acidiphilium sp. PA]MCW8306481.1 class II fructose-bisphosphatase [Acidiphilium sp. PA]
MTTDKSPSQSDRNLALELVRVTEAAALAASLWIGRGDKNSADGAAVGAMRQAFNAVAINGLVVIGEGEMDEAPMLYIGERVGAGGPEMDIAVDPLEGTYVTAKGAPNAIAVIALAERGNFLHAPDIYMDKIAVGPGLPTGVVTLNASVRENLRNLARAKKCDISDLMVCTLDRERHAEMIAQCREAGARISLIGDGDVSGLIAVSQPETGIDLFIGSGGAPEGVLAAAALRCIGGQMQGRLLYEDDAQIERTRGMGISDPHRIYNLDEMARGNVMFAATGVTSGPMLRGVRRFGTGAITHSTVMRSKSGTVRTIEARHNFETKTWVESKPAGEPKAGHAS